MFKGSYVAVVTPIKGGKIDEKAFRSLVQFHLDNGTDGLVPCGSTGEAATMTMDEHKRVIKIALEVCNGKIPVIPGTGSNNTVEAVELTSFAKKAGCDGALVVCPYYNNPTPEGQYRHFEKISAEVDIPIVLYNVPSRTGTSMLPETIARLSKIDNIVAIKEAAGSVQQVVDIISRCDLTVLSGDDGMTFPFMSVGAKGVISVVANIIPSQMHELVQTYLDGDIDASRKIHFEIQELCNAIFIETNPIPVKTALDFMGKLDAEWRLPLCEMQPENKEKLKTVLEKYKLI
jgi:4-hydroxy-tetrahydrodipicolinate synthase